jgi:hypothetical protein
LIVLDGKAMTVRLNTLGRGLLATVLLPVATVVYAESFSAWALLSPQEITVQMQDGQAVSNAALVLDASALTPEAGLVGPEGRYKTARDAVVGLHHLLATSALKLNEQDTLFRGRLARDLDRTIFTPKRPILVTAYPGQAGDCSANGTAGESGGRSARIDLSYACISQFVRWVIFHEFLHVSGEGHNVNAGTKDPFMHSAYGFEIVGPCADYAVGLHAPYAQQLCAAQAGKFSPAERGLLELRFLASRAMAEPARWPFEEMRNKIERLHRTLAPTDSMAKRKLEDLNSHLARFVDTEQGAEYSSADAQALAQRILAP